MSPIRLVILGLMLVFGVWAARRRGRRWYLVLALAALLGLGLQLLLFWPRLSQPKLDFFDLLGAVLVVFLAADARGLPSPLARRLRIGLYSREWEYDRHLTALGHRVDQLFRANPGASDAAAYGRGEIGSHPREPVSSSLYGGCTPQMSDGRPSPIRWLVTTRRSLRPPGTQTSARTPNPGTGKRRKSRIGGRPSDMPTTTETPSVRSVGECAIHRRGGFRLLPV